MSLESIQRILDDHWRDEQQRRRVLGKCPAQGCERALGHVGVHSGRPSCRHRDCADECGHIDECREDNPWSL